MKKRLKIVVPLAVLLVLGGFYKFVLAQPVAEGKPKVDGKVYVLPKEFLANLSDGHYAKVNVALVLAEDQAIAGHGAEAGAKPPEGFGPLEQEAVVRSLITDVLTEATSRQLRRRRGRAALKRRILRAIKTGTDVHVLGVMFTDVAVQ